VAKITITIEDGFEDGQAVATADFEADHQGAPEGSPPTDAAIFATAIQRLWTSRALEAMAPLICDDMMRISRRAKSDRSAPTLQ
jgi:hypothetical protein